MSLSLKLIILGILFAALAGAGAYVHHHIYQSGWDARDVQAKAEIQAANDKAAAELTAANDRIRSLSLAMSRNLDSIGLKNYEGEQRAQAKINSLDTELRASRLRLSILVATGSCHSAGQDQGAGPAAVPGEERADLMPETAVAFVDAAAESARDVRERNECIERYNTIRQAVNAQ